MVIALLVTNACTHTQKSARLNALTTIEGSASSVSLGIYYSLILLLNRNHFSKVPRVLENMYVELPANSISQAFAHQVQTVHEASEYCRACICNRQSEKINRIFVHLARNPTYRLQRPTILLLLRHREISVHHHQATEDMRISTAIFRGDSVLRMVLEAMVPCHLGEIWMKSYASR